MRSSGAGAKRMLSRSQGKALLRRRAQDLPELPPTQTQSASHGPSGKLPIQC